MKKLIALLLVLSMVFAMAACSGGSSQPAQTGGTKKLVIADDEWYGTDPYQQDT